MVEHEQVPLSNLGVRDPDKPNNPASRCFHRARSNRLQLHSGVSGVAHRVEVPELDYSRKMDRPVAAQSDHSKCGLQSREFGSDRNARGWNR